MKKAAGGEVKAAVHKHEKNMHPGKPMTKLAKGGLTAMKGEMLPDTSKLGIKMNKNPGMRKGVPVAPKSPMIEMSKGGCVKR